MADDEQFSLCWNNFNTNLSAGFHESLCRGDLVDVTLAAEGQLVKAHRLVLSVCSPYFRKMFTQMPANQHAFVFLKDVSHCALKDLIQFMYCGEVNVKQDALPAFISTAEALQIKGLTDGDPAPSQSPAKPSTPAPQPTPIVQQTMTSPRIGKQQRPSTSRSYKIETIEDSGDDKATQIVLQSTPQQSLPQTTLVQTTTAVVSQKRPAQRSITTPQTKRSKNTADPLEATEPTQITVQTVSESNKSTTSDTEFIDLPIELPTKSEPDYTEDAGEVETAEQETTYVEDDSYGDMKYDDSYFTENEEGNASVSGAGVAATSSAVVKQQAFSDNAYVDQADQSANEAQDDIVEQHSLLFIESPWSTPCLVLDDFIYNCHSKKNGKEYWRCHNYSKKAIELRCRSRCVLENNKLKSCSGGSHNHPPHTEKINKIMQRNRLIVSPEKSEPRLRDSSRNVSADSTMAPMRNRQVGAKKQGLNRQGVIPSRTSESEETIIHRVHQYVDADGTSVIYDFRDVN